MEDLTYFKTLRDNKQADDNVLFLLGKLLKSRGSYTEALSVYGELMQKQNDALNDMILYEITEINAIRKAGAAEPAAPADSVEAERLIEESVTDHDEEYAEDGPAEDEQAKSVVPAFRVYRGNSEKSYLPRVPKKGEITFKDVGGLDELKKTIEMRIVKPFQTPEVFARFRQRSGGGLLLYGPPGCGKTYIARATAGECSAYFRSVRITDILGQYIGESELNLQNVFATARARRPCVLFFDEIDTLGFNRMKSSSMDSRGVVDQLLSEIEGIDSNTDKLLIIGATNMPWDVDDALRRPGRFDRSVFVPPPDCDAREVIFRLKLEGRPLGRIDYRALAEKSPFFSGADIEHVVELAVEKVLEEVLRTGNRELLITQDTLVKTLSKEKPSTLSWLKTIGDYVRYANHTGYFNDVENYLRDNSIR